LLAHDHYLIAVRRHLPQAARPCTEWLDETIARDEDSFILTGSAIGREHLLEASVPGVSATKSEERR
jgi:hypothetical protein